MGLAALFTLLVFMIVGSLAMLKTGGYDSINAMPLFQWIGETSLANSWWLIISLVSLGLIALNTILCSVKSLLAKTPARSFLLKISPQIMHAGFLFILLAHLFSSYDSFHHMTAVSNYQGIRLDESRAIGFSDIKLSVSKTGFPTGMSTRATMYENGNELSSQVISPNHPAFINGLGIYLKNIQPYPVPTALIEISRDAGSSWALVGGILFFVGNMLLVILKWRHESVGKQR